MQKIDKDGFPLPYRCNLKAGQILNRIEIEFMELNHLCKDHKLPIFRLPVNKRKFYDEEWKDVKLPYIRYFTIFEGVEFYHNKKIKKKDSKKKSRDLEVIKKLQSREKNKKNPQSDDKEPRELEPNIDDMEWRV